MPDCPHPYELQSYVDGELAAQELGRVGAHVASCDECASRAGEFERVHQFLPVHPAPVPEALAARTLELLKTTPAVRRLSCRAARPLVSEYVDDALDQRERETLEAHLFACEGCFADYVAMRTTAEALRQRPQAVASGDLASRIMTAVVAEAAQTSRGPVPVAPRPFAWRRALVPVAATLMLAMVALGAFSVMNQTQAPGPATTIASRPSSPTGEPAPTGATPDAGPADAPVAGPLAEEPAVAAAPEAADAAVPAPERVTPEPSMTLPRVPDVAPTQGLRAPTAATPGRPVSRPSAPASVTRFASVAPAVRPAPSAPAAPRRTVVIAPPTAASAAHPSGLGRSVRTAPRTYTRPSVIAPSGGYPSPPVVASVPHTDVGVTAARPLGRSTVAPSAPRPTPTRVAELTRPQPRVVAPAVTPRLEETSGSYLAVSGSYAPRRTASAKPLGTGTGDPDVKLAERTRSMKESGAREREAMAADW